MNNSNSILNNKSELNSVSNKLHHDYKNQNGVAKSVIIGFDKNTLDYKNNKNLILNQKQNKVDINGNSTMTNNYYNQSNNQKNLNGVKPTKSEVHSKRFIITNCVENCDKLRNVMFHIVKPQNGVDQPDVRDGLLLINGSGCAAKDETPNALENIPNNVNIHKVNGFHLSDPVRNGTSAEVPANVQILKSPNEKPRNGFIRNCSHNARPNDFSTIKINYVSRQVRAPTNGFVCTNGKAANGNRLHDTSKTATNMSSIPNIVINGSASDVCDKAAEKDDSSIGKQTPFTPVNVLFLAYLQQARFAKLLFCL